MQATLKRWTGTMALLGLFLAGGAGLLLTIHNRDPANLLEGSTQQATVLFADVRAFTSLSETRPL